MVKTSADSSSEKDIKAVSNDPLNHTQGVEDSSISVIDEVASNASRTLPANSESKGVINWLGSSFSGSDIKVVAHLYSEIGDDELVRIQNQLDESRNLETALGNFLAGFRVTTTNFFPDLEKFVLASGFNLGNVPRGFVRYYTLFQNNPSKTYELMQKERDIIAQSREGLEERLSQLQEIKKNATATLVLATLQTISVQTHRDKRQVRGLGQAHVKGWTRGARTIAGSMIFTMFDEHSLLTLIRSMASNPNKYGELNSEISSYLADQLPPLDLTIVFANEYGALAKMTIYGVEFINDGLTLSIEDLLTEQVLNFVARDIDIPTSRGNIRLSHYQRGMNVIDFPNNQSASNLLISSQNSYNEYLRVLGIRRSLVSI